jgi:thiosulfate/3-mercaptopyruvate sulfurtransferase
MLVSPDWLARCLDDPGTVVVDLRWREDGSARDRFDAGHIPGAAFCDWTSDLVDPDHRYAFMLAPSGRFASLMRRLGVAPHSTIVAYADERGSGPFRLWWACRVYGHDQVRILDGGLERWVAEGRRLESGARSPAGDLAGDRQMPERGDRGERTTASAEQDEARAQWSPRPRLTEPATADDVAAAQHDPSTAVIDSRPPTQFEGREVWFETGPVQAGDDGIARTPRGPLRAGHVPWSLSVPSAALYAPDGTMKDPDELRAVFADAGLPEESLPTTTVICYCGVGISGSALVYAALRAGARDARLYDASWDEWGRDPDRPIATARPPAGG